MLSVEILRLPALTSGRIFFTVLWEEIVCSFIRACILEFEFGLIRWIINPMKTDFPLI